MECSSVLARLRERIYGRIFLFRLLTGLTFGGVAGGLLIFLLAGFGRLGRADALALAVLTLALATLWAAREARLQCPHGAALLRLLAAENPVYAGFLFAESLPAAWEKELPALREPRVSSTARRLWGVAGMSVAFLFGGAFTPPFPVSAPVENKLAVEAQSEPLRQELDALLEENLLPREQGEQLKKELEKLTEQALGTDPAKTYEALEHLATLLQQQAEQSEQRLQQSADRFENLSELAQRLAAAEKLSEAAGNEFAALLRKMAAEDPELQKIMENMDMRSLQSMDAETLKKLAEQTKMSEQERKKALENFRKKMEECRKNGSCSGDSKEKKEGKSASDRDASLADFLNRNAGSSLDTENLKQSLQECEGSAGFGGIGRGRGDAPLTRLDRDLRAEGARHKIAVEGEATRPGAGEVLFQTVGAPQISTEKTTVNAGSLTSPGVAEERNAPSHPRHRSVIRRYFQ